MNELTKQLRQGAEQAWQSIAEGWRELAEKAGQAMTRLSPTGTAQAGRAGAKTASDPDDGERPSYPEAMGGWALMAADLLDEDERLVVRLEAPGLRREDIDVSVAGDRLVVSGRKRVEHEGSRGQWRVRQCAYGSFRRELALPAPVISEQAQARYRDGVLRFELPKAEAARKRRVPVAPS